MVRFVRALLIFTMHQCISTVAIIVGTAFITFSVVSMVHIVWPAVGNTTASLLLTEVPFFPLQLTMAAVIGGWMGKWLRQSVVFWVWVIPALVMLGAIIHGPFAQIGGDPTYSAISHFFGDGCEARYRCFDQIVFTLPLYTALAYSLGAVLMKVLMHNGSRQRDSQTEPTAT